MRASTSVLGLGYLLLTLTACGSCRDGEPPRALEDPIGAVESPPAEPTVAVDAGRPRGRDAGETATAQAALGLDETNLFLGEPDHPMRRALALGEVQLIEKGRGGRSLAFKITLADGTEGYYKPEQSFSAAHWYAELAAYHLDRELGLGRVPPAIGRRLPWAALREAAAGDRRIPEVTVQEDGTVRGAFIWWIPESLERIAPGHGWERWIRVGGGLSITPFVRPREWGDAMRRRPATAEPRPRSPDPQRSHRQRAGEPDTADRAAELSDMILFDYLTTNVDRWGGDFTNVRTRGEGGPLIYLDNGAGFSPGRARIPLMDSRLHAVQRFRRSTVERIQALDRATFERRMNRDPLAPWLSERQLEGFEERREHLLEHVSAMQDRFGAAAFPW